MKRIFALLIAGCLAQISVGKQLNVAIYFNQFLNPAGETYVETYFSLDPRSVVLQQNENGNWQGGIEILLTFEQEEKIVAYDKLKLNSTEIADSTAFMPYSIQQSRLKLAPGSYQMKIELVDKAASEEPIVMENEVSVAIDRNEVSASSILLLDSYHQSSEESVVGKWGYELVPIVPVGTYYISDNVQNLPFYCEVFNTDIAFGDNEPFLIKYYLFDNLKETPLKRYSGFQRASGAIVNPILNTFNIKNLPSGYYNLVIEVVDAKNQLTSKKEVSFYRRNIEADLNSLDLEKIVLENSFVEGLDNLDSMHFFIDCLYPVSNQSERRIEENLLSSMNLTQMQRFFLAFWTKRNPTAAKQEWLAYRKEVDYADEQFGSNTVPGYKTDMGRVLLQYGKPSIIERSPRNAYNYPWQMWQYDVLSAADVPVQNNRVFVFVDQTLSGRNYTLIHSSAISEIQDYKWKYQVQRNTNRGYDVDDASGQNSMNSMGDKVDNNFIIGDHRFWYDRQ